MKTGAINTPSKAGSYSSPEVTAEIDGVTIDCGDVAAGAFTKEIPLDASGANTLTLTLDGASYSVPLNLKISVEPYAPKMSDSHSDAGTALTLEPSAVYPKSLNAEFYVSESVPLTFDNVKVYDGSLAAITPNSIVPGTSGALASGLTPSLAVADGTNPYQIFEISLTPEQQAAPSFHLSWTGDVGGREVTAYVRTTANAWSKVGYAQGEGEQTIDMTISNSDVVLNGKLYILRAIGSISNELDPVDGVDWQSSMGYYDLRVPKEYVTYLTADVFRDKEISLLDLMLVFDLIGGNYTYDD